MLVMWIPILFRGLLFIPVLGSPNAQRSAAWTAVPDNAHYTYFSTKEHTNEDTKPKSRRLLRRVGRHKLIIYTY
jgi:hypothetical protein